MQHFFRGKFLHVLQVYAQIVMTFEGYYWMFYNIFQKNTTTLIIFEISHDF